MPFRARSIFREAATAIAVLALYVLLLLAPLHQAAGLQRDLNALGYASLDLWSICIPNTRSDGSKPVEPAKCPIAGIGKHDIAPAGPASIVLPVPGIALDVVYAREAPLHNVLHPSHVAQARAPPVKV